MTLVRQPQTYPILSPKLSIRLLGVLEVWYN